MINFFKSTSFIATMGLTLVIAMAILVAAPQARAESPNILVGQDLTIGSTNQNVVVLQGLLSELGYLNVPFGIPFGYYGSLTKNAVARYQASMGVVPAVGYYGPLTKIAMHSDFSSHGWLPVLGW
ncbi:MAG: peptidoglycan-binding domain-containing protein [Candidatus Paceibacterota bacterium]|jgi:peptidoglycan hydrolase-like protein with peptidoglycan-binding domain